MLQNLSMAKGLQKRRTNDPEGVRKRIVDTAFNAFTTRGYGVTTVQDLKAAARVTGGAFSHHFPTKKELGLAVLNGNVADAVEETWIKPISQAKAASDGIEAIFTKIIRELDQQGFVSGCPLGNMVSEPAGQDGAMREAAIAILDQWRSELAQKIRADQLAGRYAHLDAEAAAIFIIASYWGAMGIAKASQSSSALKDCGQELLKYLDLCPGQKP
ncbi:transcriptional regulator, TetR family [Rhizobium mongolense subsp. loessense]|uniref:Transcriptional regulator, TetR family n=2 Tax=Rhizobium mongolense TaxID=57676 RepID=A0A1G4QQB9_9HYPH|nr:transcriptional regulator, TetR family [Rhizobium mongolense subsp. loessense]